jgi:hypothetical protein
LALACEGPPPPAAPVSLDLRGLSPDYRSHFADPELVDGLGRALAECVDGPVVVRVDYADGAGTLRASGSWRTECRPADLDLRPVQPIARALAAYRDGLAVRYDRRLARFATGVDLDGCVVWLAGQVPPDGTTFGCASAEPCLLTGPAAERLAPERAGCLRPEPPPTPGAPTPR